MLLLDLHFFHLVLQGAFCPIPYLHDNLRVPSSFAKSMSSRALCWSQLRLCKYEEGLVQKQSSVLLIPH